MRASVVVAAASLLAALVAAVPTAGAADPAACAPWAQKTVKSGLGSLENLEFDGAGALLISATDQGAIERLTPDGTVSTLVPNVNAPGGQRLVGRTLYFNTGDAAASGLTGTADGTIDQYHLDTKTRRTFATGLTMPNGLATLPNGDFVVSRDIGSGTGITRVPINAPGNPEVFWAPLDDQNGLAVDPTGKWLYADQTFTSDSAVYKIRIAEPTDLSVVAKLGDNGPKGLDDMTIDSNGILYVAANLTGEVIRLDPATGDHCTIVSGLQNPSSLKFGRGPGWSSNRLYVTGFDGTVRELTPPESSQPPPTGAPTAGAVAPDRIALSVRPRSTVAGRRTRFRFVAWSVHSGKRTRLSGARVTLGGRVAKTDRHGAAAITLRFRHPGTRTARAAASGYTAAATSVRVQPASRR
jgi:sugar lactone lactonase YvrE